jgi:uncharacterized Zn-finger protein
MSAAVDWATTGIPDSLLSHTSPKHSAVPTLQKRGSDSSAWNVLLGLAAPPPTALPIAASASDDVESDVEHDLSKKLPDLPNTCEHCRKSFQSKHALIMHRRSHTDERPYQCCKGASF